MGLFSKLRSWFAAAEDRPPKPARTAASSGKDKRKSERYHYTLPATFSDGFALFPERVHTKNINAHGLYFESDYALPVGSTIDIVTTLPSVLTHAEMRRVHYQASVVRVDENKAENKFGIAAEIKRCETLPDPRPRLRKPADEAVKASSQTPEQKPQPPAPEAESVIKTSK